MAIEQMKLLNLVGALDEENSILQELVLCENVHLNLEHSDAYDNNYVVHEYESMLPSGENLKEENYAEMESKYNEILNEVEEVAIDLELPIHIVKEGIRNYSKEQAVMDFKKIRDRMSPSIQTIKSKREQIKELKLLIEQLNAIDRYINFSELNALQYFEYEIGMLSRDNRIHIKRNYENISAVVLEIGEIEDSKEDIYIIFYLTEFVDETQKILKSLNWNKLNFPIDLAGDVECIKKDTERKISVLEKQINRLEKDIFENKEETILLLNKIYTRMELENKIVALKAELFRGNNVFVLSAWIREKDYSKLEEHIAEVTDKYVMLSKDPKELGKGVIPPTLLKNNWFVKPFEMIVKLYGLPTYNEIDPTAFLAITFCLMFGIMFGDIGQGLVYFLAGFAVAKKNKIAGGILKRLGCSSILFGFIYGSAFGLEEIPILKDIAPVHGGPLNTANIMPILLVGVGFGVAVLTISFLFGIINALRRRDMEHALFGKNGVAGYLFFMGLIMTAVCLVGAIPVSILVPISIMIITLIIMVFKEPLGNFVIGKGLVIHGDKGSYYIESGFEGVETILSTLSNAISFIRVGAFALNHAGLFLAFSVMAEMVPSVVLKVIILILGNLLILTLEGLVVFIQGLRLQYYEMFSKYFSGDGVAYNPVKIENK